jgi:hypothetical protein
MIRFRIAIPLFAALFSCAASLAAEDGAKDTQAMPADCPMHAAHTAAAAKGAGADASHNHAAGVDRRGDQAMGFSHAATSHHFVLTATGGEIRVEANDADDAASRDQIRSHLSAIAKSFAAGDFNSPMFIHDRIPPGVPALESLRDAVSYTYAETARGGRVDLRTENAEALAAIHEFLRFQIEDHRTGDPLEVAAR